MAHDVRVNTAAAGHDAIADSAVWERSPGDAILVIVLHHGLHCSAHQLLRYLSERVPQEALPSRILFVADAIPRRASGGLDVVALAELVGDGDGAN